MYRVSGHFWLLEGKDHYCTLMQEHYIEQKGTQFYFGVFEPIPDKILDLQEWLWIQKYLDDGKQLYNKIMDYREETIQTKLDKSVELRHLSL